jgi:hypothetical protein
VSGSRFSGDSNLSSGASLCGTSENCDRKKSGGKPPHSKKTGAASAAVRAIDACGMRSFPATFLGLACFVANFTL